MLPLRPLALACLACVLFASVLALQQDLAGKVDWHTALIGTPRRYPVAVSPRALKSTEAEAERDLVVAVTEKNVFAGVVDGNVCEF
jgi:hypothetical protein